jgi:hypothetical protein
MPDLYTNPAEEPAPEGYQDRNTDMQDWGGSHMEPAGPGGKTSNVNGNEKGILEVGLFRTMALHQASELGSNHDSFAQGIYADTDGQYSD